MTPQDLVTELTDFGFGDLGTTALMRSINYAIKNIAQRRAWPFLEKVMTLTFDGLSATPSNSPADLRAVMKIMDLSVGRRIRYKRTDDIEEQYGTGLTTTGGTPYFYYFEGSALKVYQVPTSTQTLRLRYLRTAPSVLQSDPESAIIIPPDYHEAIAFRAMVRLYDQDDDNTLSARAEAHYENLMAQMEDALMVRQHDEPEFVHVIDADDFDYYWPN